ncbi:MAG: hypothetical protein ACLSA2_04655 [Candidatus Gastranaerophilaceae bacterium]|nr:unknown [Clostridium sp. CAG:967]
MKWIILLLLVAAGAWAYFNVDFSQLGSNAENAVRNEKTIKKFFESDQQGKDQLNKTIQENF